MGHESSFCWMSVLYSVLWFALASALLWMTWNKVLASIWKLKAVKFWQSLLVIGTVCVLCFPYYSMKRSHLMGKGCQSGSCMKKHCSKCCKKKCKKCYDEEASTEASGEKEDCPYSRDKASEK